MPSSHLILCRHLLLLPPVPPSIRVFSNESTLRTRWQCIGVSALASFLPKNTQGWSPLEWTGWISLQSKGLSGVFSKTTVQKHQFFGTQLSLWSMRNCWKNHSFDYTDFVSKVMSLLFNMLSRLVIAFLPRGKHLLISWLQSPSVVILEPKKIKSFTVSTVYPSICHEVMGLDAMILVIWMLSFEPVFHSSHSFSSRGSLILLHFFPWGWFQLHIWGFFYISPCSLDTSLCFTQPGILHDVLCI